MRARNLAPVSSKPSAPVVRHPLVSVHFPVLLLLSPPAVVTAVERLGNDVCVAESCDVSSHPVFLCSERGHKRCVVLFHALVSHSVHSHPARTYALRGPSAGAEHARVEPRAHEAK